MQPIELSDPAKIEEFLSKISLTGKGFTTECLLMDAYDAGLDYPDYLKAEGEDPDAVYDGKSPAWAKYHMRQGKRVFMVYGDKEKDRRTHFSETPWPGWHLIIKEPSGPNLTFSRDADSAIW